MSHEEPTESQEVILKNGELARLKSSSLDKYKDQVELKQLLINKQVAILWVDLTNLPTETTPAEFYPILRKLALTIDEDCKQMGLVVPVVIALQISEKANANNWVQIDSDTDINAGEFIVRIPTKNQLINDTKIPTPTSTTNEEMRSFLIRIAYPEFSQTSLKKAIEPINDSTFKKALTSIEATSFGDMHKKLIRDFILSSWENPTQLTPRLNEYIDSFGESQI